MVALLLFFWIVSAAAIAQPKPRMVFAGVPSVKVTEGGSERVHEPISREQAAALKCAVSELEGRFFWASRDNREMMRTVSGAFVTYVAVDGSGYVRAIDGPAKNAASRMSSTEAQFDYVEHLAVGLRSVTYYGRAQ
ncbi:MAG TPA: hypothetical protein VNG69_01865 [Casimicrobiaceae bacterium]|nr:hypothetical protein [Casimicrobiaceae bacterium]